MKWEQRPARAYPRRRNGVEAGMAEVKKNSVPRIISLFIAFIGCVITAIPFMFQLGSDPAPLILVGSGVTVIALGLFLFFSI
jgi:hypothetical protein